MNAATKLTFYIVEVTRSDNTVGYATVDWDSGCVDPYLVDEIEDAQWFTEDHLADGDGGAIQIFLNEFNDDDHTARLIKAETKFEAAS